MPMPIPSDDPYGLVTRTTSYGVDNDRHSNSLFVSAKFGAGLMMEQE